MRTRIPSRAYMDSHRALYQGSELASNLGNPRKPRVQYERAHQEHLASLVRGSWFAPYWFHVPQERKSKREAHELWRAGVQSGLLDNVLLLPRHGYAMAWAELKAHESGTKPSQAQRFVMTCLDRCGVACAWHTSGQAAFDWFAAYAGEPQPGDPPPPSDLEDAAILLRCNEAGTPADFDSPPGERGPTSPTAPRPPEVVRALSRMRRRR